MGIPLAVFGHAPKPVNCMVEATSAIIKAVLVNIK